MRALITGAADGLGKALADAVIAVGGSVVGVDRDMTGLDGFGGAMTAVLADLSDPVSLDTACARIVDTGPYDLVVLNAGVNATGLFEAIPATTQDEVLAVNLVAPMVLCAALVRAGSLTPGATLCFIASLSCFTGYPGAAVYAATKQGVAVFARSLRRPLGKRGIHTLTVFPGPLDTPHAARHAPPGTSARTAARRMPPDVAAGAILRRVGSSGILVPGTANKASAVFGTLAPEWATALMRRWVFAPFEQAGRGG